MGWSYETNALALRTANRDLVPGTAHGSLIGRSDPRAPSQKQALTTMGVGPTHLLVLSIKDDL